MTQEKQVAVVTGSSSGIGFETCLTMARNGYNTYATMRKIDWLLRKLLTLMW
jgi:NAD(P)-dependent dehydrogenase (short-subunit alcohol dehydrogenase family)